MLFSQKADNISYFKMFRTSINIQNGSALDNGFEIFKYLQFPELL